MQTSRTGKEKVVGSSHDSIDWQNAKRRWLPPGQDKLRHKTPLRYLLTFSPSLQLQFNTSIPQTTSSRHQFKSSRHPKVSYLSTTAESGMQHADGLPSSKMPSVNEQPTQSIQMTAQTDGVEAQQPVSVLSPRTSSWHLHYPTIPKNIS